MIKNPKLAKHIADVSWGEFVRQLEYKSEWYERSLVKIDRFFPSSKACSTKGCDFKHTELPLSVRRWACPFCGKRHDKDVNAACNIKAQGLAVLACGVTGSGVGKTL